ncbi:MAG: hypothetical protein M3Y33_21565, partial [Actinomycetota bacterium]|nr:hypothetical protein [Actinomycetota bacterium]
ARRAGQAMPAGTFPLPDGMQRRIGLHQKATAYRQQADAVLARPGALDDSGALDMALQLMDASRAARAAAGGMIAVHAGGRHVLYGAG